ncbi:MAG: S41 family peptidase [Bacteroidota bacterium]|nr:S41 family peptidase [Bacteroidota bacterium]
MDRKHINKVYQPLVFALVLLAGIFLGFFLAREGKLGNLKKQDKLKEVINYVKKNYVDSVSTEELTEKAITGMLQGLDPHSVYISAAEFHDYNDPLLGSFEGIGVEFRIERDTVTVITPVPGGPSEKIGIRAGDRIVKVNGKTIAGVKITNRDVMKQLKGPKDTKVTLTIFRRGAGGLLTFTVTRDVIPTYSLDIAYMVDKNIGYIRLNNFAETTSKEINKALNDLKSKGMKKLILDLRGNGGGFLKAAIDVADQFIPNDAKIVYTQGKHHSKEEFFATSTGLFMHGDLVILIDEYSASASEIVAGAIQDNDRGLIIGRRSFGKGLVQEQLDLKDGSAIRLTVARYYTPTGRCIQRPYANGTDDYYNEAYRRLLSGELDSRDSIKLPDSLKYKTPKGKIVYGGGGIMPDIFVPIEKDSMDKYYIALVNKGLIFQFAFDYTDKYRDMLNHYRNFASFDRNFQITDNIFRELIAYCEKNGVKRNIKETPEGDRKIKVLLKAYIGRNVLDNDGFYPYLNTIDPVFLKAVETLSHHK